MALTYSQARQIHDQMDADDAAGLAREIADHVKEQQKWIKIEEGGELPRIGYECLVVMGGRYVDMAYRMLDGWRMTNGARIHEPQPTHWRKIPPLPDGDAA